MLRLKYDNIMVYELIDRQLASETVAQAQRRIVRRKLVNSQCALLDDGVLHLLARAISSLVNRFRALAVLTGHHREKTPATLF